MSFNVAGPVEPFLLPFPSVVFSIGDRDARAIHFVSDAINRRFSNAPIAGVPRSANLETGFR
jgi:hypothetical protein